MRLFGLIGFPLSHSFSKKYFTEKFQKENIADAQYENFEIEDINAFPNLIQENKDLCGLNVTIPHKLNVIPFLDEVDPAAKKIGAVNVIKFEQNGKLVGHNSDYIGFKRSLQKLIPEQTQGLKALVFGTGGASKAVLVALDDLSIPYVQVSRKGKGDIISYEDLDEGYMNQYRVLINTSPLGMTPNVDSCPNIPYQFMTKHHYLYDLVYNPLETLFMKKGLACGAKVSNGLEMLHLQAERAWEIWNS